MNIKKLMNTMFYTQDTIKAFTEYAKKLDEYFKDEDNIENHYSLYCYYIELKDNLKELAVKHKVVV